MQNQLLRAPTRLERDPCSSAILRSRSWCRGDLVADVGREAGIDAEPRPRAVQVDHPSSFAPGAEQVGGVNDELLRNAAMLR